MLRVSKELPSVEQMAADLDVEALEQVRPNMYQPSHFCADVAAQFDLCVRSSIFGSWLHARGSFVHCQCVFFLQAACTFGPKYIKKTATKTDGSPPQPLSPKSGDGETADLAKKKKKKNKKGMCGRKV